MAIDGFDFTTIPAGRIDPDSPLSTDLFVDMTDNMEFLERWLGKSYVGAADHNHDDVNSKAIDYADLVGSAPGAPTEYTEAGKSQTRTDVMSAGPSGPHYTNHTIVLPVASVDFLILGRFTGRADHTSGGGVTTTEIQVNGVLAVRTAEDLANSPNRQAGTFIGKIQDGQVVRICNSLTGSGDAGTATGTFDIISYQRLF